MLGRRCPLASVLRRMDRESDEEDKEAIGQRIGKLDRIESEEINFFAFNCDYILLLYMLILKLLL